MAQVCNLCSKQEIKLHGAVSMTCGTFNPVTNHHDHMFTLNIGDLKSQILPRKCDCEDTMFEIGHLQMVLQKLADIQVGRVVAIECRSTFTTIH